MLGAFYARTHSDILHVLLLSVEYVFARKFAL